VTRSRTVVIAGAGIGGLTLALALARRGFRALVLEQAEHLEEIGAGIQLSPNATRILIDLGLRAAIEPVVVAPEAIRVLSGRSARQLAWTPLGRAAEFRYGAPFWVIHRGDLQGALLKAARSTPDVALRLGMRVEDFATHARGVTVAARTRTATRDEHGIALVGADGLWSTVRAAVGDSVGPQFRRYTAWRALLPAEAVAPDLRRPLTTLWLGPDAHLVHYPVRAGRMINIVAIVADSWNNPGWNTPGARSEIVEKFARWAEAPRALLATPPDAWSKWALYDCEPLRRWGDGPVTLLGDAAHPTLPFLAQGGAMAIEDAAVLAVCLGRTPDDPAAALQAYQGMRRPRTTRIVREARRNGTIYHLAGPAALARNLLLGAMGGENLLTRYDWLYDWKPP